MRHLLSEYGGVRTVDIRTDEVRHTWGHDELLMLGEEFRSRRSNRGG
jgi:hypothetical protein